MLNLHSLKSALGSTHRKKRLGRGNASGRGNYSTRGLKGQKARSGGKSGLDSFAIKEYMLRIPKNRGFRSLQPTIPTVNIRDLQKNFADHSTVNLRSLLKAKLIPTTVKGVKILSNGKLTKKLTVEASAFSKLAKEKIEKAGGKIIMSNKVTAEETKPDTK